MCVVPRSFGKHQNVVTTKLFGLNHIWQRHDLGNGIPAASEAPEGRTAALADLQSLSVDNLKNENLNPKLADGSCSMAKLMVVVQARATRSKPPHHSEYFIGFINKVESSGRWFADLSFTLRFLRPTVGDSGVQPRLLNNKGPRSES